MEKNMSEDDLKIPNADNMRNISASKGIKVSSSWRFYIWMIIIWFGAIAVTDSVVGYIKNVDKAT